MMDDTQSTRIGFVWVGCILTLIGFYNPWFNLHLERASRLPCSYAQVLCFGSTTTPYQPISAGTASGGQILDIANAAHLDAKSLALILVASILLPFAAFSSDDWLKSWAKTLHVTESIIFILALYIGLSDGSFQQSVRNEFQYLAGQIPQLNICRTDFAVNCNLIRLTVDGTWGLALVAVGLFITALGVYMRD